jgi:hypothetical protein
VSRGERGRAVLAALRGAPGGGAPAPLAELHLAGGDSWVLSLVRAWASVGEVLGFYQERIAEEGSLGSAREDLSVRELARMIDYKPLPPTAAATDLSFQVAPVPGMPTVLALGRGVRVQSLPPHGQTPQIFETVEEIDVRREWNAMKPRVPSMPLRQLLLGGTRELRLDGATTGVKAGDALLVVARPPASRTPAAAPPAGAATPPAGAAASPPAASSPPAAAPGEERFLRLVETVEPQRATKTTRAWTRAAWSGVLDPSRPRRNLGAFAAFTFADRARLFGADARPWSDVPEATKREVAPPAGGLLLAPPPWTSWLSVEGDLPDGEVRSVAVTADGSLFAATDAGGVHRSTDGGATWLKKSEGLGAKEVTVLFADARGDLWAGTTDGTVARSLDGGDTWEALRGTLVKRKGRRWVRVDTRMPKSPVRCLAVGALRGRRSLFAGTDQGIYRSTDDGTGWEAINDGLPGADEETGKADLSVRAVAIGPLQGVVFIGTAKGVFRSTSFGGGWAAAGRGLPADLPAPAVAATSDRRSGERRVFAAVGGAVYRSDDLGRSWQSAAKGLPGTGPHGEPAGGGGAAGAGGAGGGAAPAEIVALLPSSDPATRGEVLFAATSRGLYVSGDGASWAPVAGRPGEVAVPAVGAAPDGALLAATPLVPTALDEWPGFHLAPGAVDLDRTDPRVPPGGWLALRQAAAEPDGGDLVAVLRVRGVASVERHDFGLDRVVTRLEVDPDADLSAFDLRTTEVYLRSRELAPYVEQAVRDEPMPAERVELAERLDEGFGRRTVFVSGKPIRARFARRATTVQRTDEPGATVELGSDDEVQVLSVAEAGPGLLGLDVRWRGSARGRVVVPRGEVVWRPALADDEALVERVAAEVDEPRLPPPATTLLLDPPLRTSFDPRTVAIAANVAAATQGGSVSELLGSGAQARPNQRFTLTSPLTWLADPEPPGVRSTLEVRVDGVLWREVPGLLEAGPADQVYMLRTAGDGRTEVVFGDGVHGSRLPTGRDNVAAAYRTGTWAQAVPAGHLRQLLTRPMGLRSVINPLAAPPGTPAEAASETRWRAPLSVRTLGRVVSFDDYEDFVVGYPGIAKALTASFWRGGEPLVHVTFAAAGGRPVPADDSFARTLAAAVEDAAAAPRPVDLATYRPALYDVGARLTVDRRYVPSEVESAALAALDATLGFAAATLAGELAASTVVAALEGVAGVIGVALTAFHPSGEGPGVRRLLRARPARQPLPGGEVTPAELLLPRTGGVSVEVAREVAA